MTSSARLTCGIALAASLAGCVEPPGNVSVSFRGVNEYQRLNPEGSSELILPVVVHLDNKNGINATIKTADVDLIGPSKNDAQGAKVDCASVGQVVVQGVLAHPVEVRGSSDGQSQRLDIPADIRILNRASFDASAVLDMVMKGQVRACGKLTAKASVGRAREFSIDAPVTIDASASGDAASIAPRKTAAAFTTEEARKLVRVKKVRDATLSLETRHLLRAGAVLTVESRIDTDATCRSGTLRIRAFTSRPGARGLIFYVPDFIVGASDRPDSQTEVTLRGTADIGDLPTGDRTILDDISGNGGKIVAYYSGICSFMNNDFPIEFPVPMMLMSADQPGYGRSGDDEAARIKVEPPKPEMFTQLIAMDELSSRVRKAVVDSNARGASDLAVAMKVTNPLPGAIRFRVEKLAVRGPIRTKNGVPMDPPRLVLFEGNGNDTLVGAEAGAETVITGPKTKELMQAAVVAVSSGLNGCELEYDVVLDLPVFGKLSVHYLGALALR